MYISILLMITTLLWILAYMRDGVVQPLFPIFYNLPVIFYHNFKGDYLEWLLSLSNDNYFTLQTPLKATTRIMDGPSVEKVLNDSNYMISEERAVKGYELFGEGLLANSGKTWRVQRSKLTKLASTNLIKEFMHKNAIQVMNDMVKELIRKGEVNIRIFISKYVVRLLFYYFFNVDILFNDREIEVFDDMVRYYKYRTYNPLWHFFVVFQLSYEKKITLHKESIRRTVVSICQKVNNHHYSFILNLLVAGIDTTSRLISVYLYNGYESENLEYGLLETMRLYPPLPTITRMAMVDDVLPNGARIKAGDHVSVFLFGQGRSKRIWGSDYNEFKPERWLSKQTQTPTRAFFSMGPRNCPGSKFAIEESKLIINNLRHHFKISRISEVGLDQMPLGIFCGDKLMLKFDLLVK